MLDYKNMTIDDIIDWCVANGETEWLKRKANEKKACKVYPRKKVDGKSVADKTAEPKVEKRPISFIQLKIDFVDKFMPEIAPEKKSKEPTFYDKIKNL
jgi:hypothetical protein